MPSKSTTEEFISKAKLIHGDKYDYSLVEYINSLTKVKIVLNNVIYEQVAMDHLRGHEPDNNHTTRSTEDFIKKAKAKYGNKYDYSKVNYTNQKNKIIVIYNGVEYLQSPRQHLGGFKPELINKLTQDEFIKKCSDIHNNQYDYSLVVYKNLLSKIKIKFGDKTVEQLAGYHIYGYNPIEFTPISKGELRIIKFLIENKIDYIKEHNYDDCIRVKKLRFDFYLTKYNLLIEYDGIQHFEIIEQFGGEENFIKRKENDEIKNNYAKENNIPLLRVCYKHYDLIDDLITEFIKIHSISNSLGSN